MNSTTAIVNAAFISIALAACGDGAPPSAAAEPKASPQLRLAADMELSSKVKNVLQEPARSHVEVAAADGVVTLYGTVEAPTDSERVALLAMGVDGVRSVVNNLIVLRGS